jgi:GNAT superfamily N-acetyltransferase
VRKEVGRVSVRGVDDAVRIAAAQLLGLSRKRNVVTASPFVGMMVPGGPAFLDYAVAERPGGTVRELGDSLEILRAAFAPGPVRFELIDEACPGAVELLIGAGVEVVGRFPLLTLDPAKLTMPGTPAGATVRVSVSKQDAIDAERVASVAFESEPRGDPDVPGAPADGGSVIAHVDGEPVATAFWTAVADGVSEIAGVATLPAFRGRGLGALVTAAAVEAARDRAGVRLAWLTPGHDGADRIYRRAGFVPAANAVHLVAH